MPIAERDFKVTVNENDLGNSNRSFEKITKHKGLSIGGNLLSTFQFSNRSGAAISKSTTKETNAELKAATAAASAKFDQLTAEKND